MTLRESDVQNSIQQLKEILPQHSEATIERVLREKHGVIDSALNVLLSMPPETSAPKTPTYHSPPGPSHSTAPSKPTHIFPSDFLRWPPNARVERDQIGGEVVNHQPEPQFIYQPPLADYDADQLQPLTPQDLKAQKTSSWSKFKQKFKKDKNYSQI